MVYQQESERLKDLSLAEYLRLVFHRQIKEFIEHPELLKIGVDIIQLADQPIYRRIMQQYQGSANTYFIPFIQHEMQQGEFDSRVKAQLLNFMLVSLGQYMIYRYSSADLKSINTAMIDEIVDDLDYILANSIYTASPK